LVQNQIKPEDLMSKAEIARMFHVGGSAINNWLKRPFTGFPQPWGYWEGATTLWLRSDVEEWAALREARAVELKQQKIERLRKELAELEGS
jgi:hypothetical protein